MTILAEYNSEERKNRSVYLRRGYSIVVLYLKTRHFGIPGLADSNNNPPAKEEVNRTRQIAGSVRGS